MLQYTVSAVLLFTAGHLYISVKTCTGTFPSYYCNGVYNVVKQRINITRVGWFASYKCFVFTSNLTNVPLYYQNILLP